MRPTDAAPATLDAHVDPVGTVATAERRRWPETLRALREARGVTQEGWAALLGVSRKTVQRWEQGTRAPDPGAEAAILRYCRDAGLLRRVTRGPLAGVTLTEEGLRDLFAEARWRGPGGRGPGPTGVSPTEPAHTGDAPVVGGVTPPSPAPSPLPPLPAFAPAAPPVVVPPVAALPIPPSAAAAARETSAAGEAVSVPVSSPSVAPVSPSSPAPAAGSVPVPVPGAPPTNLPAHLTSFVGRERELAAVRRVQAGRRLLTLTGPGGGGKTRLALALAGELRWAYPHGVWFVELAPLAEQTLVPEVVVAALEVRTTGQQPPTTILLEALRERQMLLLLDNCEHLLPACAGLVETLLLACPQLEIVATSREPLGIAGETVWRVPPLTVSALPLASPKEATTDALAAAVGLGTTDAERLFVERARLRRPEFEPTPEDVVGIADICRRLDGMPLAIELAAARTSLLSVGQIAARLHDRFQLLTGGSRAALPRQQTLRATMDWSYELLSAPEQAVLRALSVFAGGFTLEAVEAVCANGASGVSEASGGGGAEGTGGTSKGVAVAARGAVGAIAAADVLDVLASLVDKSLVLVEEQDGMVRYRLLETVRQYAQERFTHPGEALALRQRHGAWCLALAELAAAALDGPQQVTWLVRLEQEHDNLRAALGWCLEQRQQSPEQTQLVATALRLAGALPRFWTLRGHLREGRQWLARALNEAGEAPAVDRARALRGAGTLAYAQGDFAAAQALFTQSLALFREVAYPHGIAEAQWNLGGTALRQGDYVSARTLLEASLARYVDLGHKPGIATLQYTLGVLHFRQGDYTAAGDRYRASLILNRELGNQHGIANALAELASVLNEQGEDGPQVALLEESQTLYRTLGEKGGVAAVLGHLGMHAGARGEFERASTLLSEGLTLYREVENRRGVARLLGIQSLVAYSGGDYARAEALCRESLMMLRAAGDTWEVGRYLWVLAGAVFGQGRAEWAARLFGAAAAVRAHLGVALPPLLQSPHDHAVAAVRASLGERAFAAAWAVGQAMSLGEVITGPLADVTPA
jgi:predicted ATPase/DNA-binding transcriptional regulator YiaG